jgi:N-acetylglutamate synthase-like GNAT family acetyltransferase
MALLDLSKIKFATAQRYVVHLSDAMPEMLGFLPVSALTHQLETQRVIMAEHEGQPCGYISRGPWKPETKIYQTAIEFELWREKHGDELVNELVRQAERHRVERITLHCAADLHANKFWAAMGFTKIGERIKSKHKRRIQNQWELRLDAAAQLDRLVERQVVRPEARAAIELLGLQEQFVASQQRKARKAMR